MALDLERINKKAISESVADQLRDKILRGEVGVGERLPPERELAPAFGTNRNTLREAIRSLEAQGLVTVRQGDGVRVADFRTSGALSLLPELLSTTDKGSDYHPQTPLLVTFYGSSGVSNQQGHRLCSDNM